jgi:pilus assembly protein FimV
MLQRAMHVFSGFALVVLFGSQAVWAVSFDRIDVASHMGEPFFAEVPLHLDGNESLAKASVELGSSSDYRILEVYRDQVVNSIRTDIISDERGSRVTLSSESAIDTAFFNLVLKVRYGRSTHYKKMPIFLESATAAVIEQSAATPVIAAAPVNAANVKPETSDAFITKPAEGAKSAFEEPEQDVVVDEGFKAYGDWARTNRYGPMVFGDTVTTVAKRLRLDERYSNQRVMVALFEKNKNQFNKGNINLIKAGTYLDVPTAEEMEQVSAEHAKQVVSEQNKVWKGMVKQPKYAAVADAQKKRYTRRVRVGQEASGVASAPMLSVDKTDAPKEAETVTKQDAPVATDAADETKLSATEEALAAKTDEVNALQGKMAGLERRLARAEEKAKSTPSAAPVTATSAALDAQNKRLEIMISRLKNQLEEAQANTNTNQGSGWMMYALVGLGLALLALIAAVVMLLRREREHPAEQEESFTDTVAPVDDYVQEEATESAEEAELATKIMDADEFEMPSASSFGEAEGGSNPADVFGDEPLEEIPDFTDDETGEMAAFDVGSDETPDPSVNYIEEADVYLRYGMEDEAEKQVGMALKLDANDPAAHAKLVQVRRAKGDEDGANESISAAKAVLSGAALVTFEGLLSSEAEASVAIDDVVSETSISDLSAEEFTGDDTGIVDFGEINFDTPKDVMEPELLDTGEMDFGEVAEDEPDDSSILNMGDSIDFSAIDFGEINLDAEESAETEEPAVEDTMLPGDLDTGELDFGELSYSEEPASEDVSPLDIDLSDALDDESTADDKEDVMLAESLDTGELDFGDLSINEDKPAEDAPVDDGSALDFDFSDAAEAKPESEGTDTDEDAMLSDALDTGELDFGDLTAPAVESTGEVDFDFSAMATDEEAAVPPTVEETLAKDDTDDEVTFGSDDLDSDVELSDYGMDFGALADDDEDTSESLDLGDLDIDFDDIDLSDTDSSDVLLTGGDTNDISSFEEDTGSFEVDGTSEVSLNDETLVVSSGGSQVESSTGLNDRDVDRALADAEEEANAVSIELDTNADDPFADANASLAKAEADIVSNDLDEGAFDSLMGEEIDVLSLNDQEDDSTAPVDEPLVDIDLEEISLDEVDNNELKQDEDLLSDFDEGLSDTELDDLESLSIDLTGFDLPADELDGDDSSPVVESVEKDLISESDSDALDIDAFDIDELDVDDILLEGLDTEEPTVDSVEKSTDFDDDFDSTVIMNRVAEDMKDVIGEPDDDSGIHFANLDDAIGEATVITNASVDPMSDEYSATAELNQIEADNTGETDAMTETSEVSSELDALMKDLNGLLDEDESKK